MSEAHDPSPIEQRPSRKKEKRHLHGSRSLCLQERRPAALERSSKNERAAEATLINKSRSWTESFEKLQNWLRVDHDPQTLKLRAPPESHYSKEPVPRAGAEAQVNLSREKAHTRSEAFLTKSAKAAGCAAELNWYDFRPSVFYADSKRAQKFLNAIQPSGTDLGQNPRTYIHAIRFTEIGRGNLKAFCWMAPS
jgi:hypothetical protein